MIDCSLEIHRELGPGLLESVYHRILAYELRKRGFRVESEAPIPVEWDGKSVEQTHHRKQTLTYLKLSGLKVGLLINFGEELLKSGIYRLVNNLEE